MNKLSETPGAGTIAQVVETLDTGGAEHLAIKIANALAERGCQSHLYVTGHDGPLAAAISADVKVRVFGYRRASIMNPVKFGLSIREGFTRFRAAIQEDGVDLIQTHLPGPNFWGLALQKRGVCPSVATIHNNQEFSYGSQRSLRGQLRQAAYRSIVRDCAATIAVSDQVRRSLLETIGLADERADRFVAIPNGIDLPPPAHLAARSATRRALSLADDQIVCLGVGRICEQKNFKDLVAVGQLLRNESAPISLVIAGDGPDMADLQERIAEAGLSATIRTLGNVTNVPELLAATDIFVMPSLWEGLPLALLEAMGARLPVVGNAIGGLNDVIADGASGFLVPVGDHRAMAAKIMDLARDPALRSKMGTAGRDLVRAQYSLDRVVDSLQTIYQEILK
jgi:glycosyltransferase involved in cell wall biosynthesis